MMDDTPDPVSRDGPKDVRSLVGSRLTNILGLIDREIKRLETHLEGLLEDPKQAKEAEQGIKNIDSLLKAMINHEGKFHEIQFERTGPAGDFALDLERAKSAVCERLASLRKAQGPASVPG